MKKLFCILMAILMLSACSGKAAVDKNKMPPEKIFTLGAHMEDSKIIIPFTEKGARLDGGRITAIQNGFTVRYLNEENELLGEINLSAKSLEKPAKCVFSNHGIFMGTENEKIPEGETAVCFIEGEWKLCGGVFFDREGNILRELPHIAKIPEEDIIPVKRARWLGEDVMAFINEGSFFFYRISEDKLYFSADYDETKI